MTYATHIAKLCEQMGVVVSPINRVLAAMMYVEESPPRIELAPIVDENSYVVALHELGHCAHGHTQGRPPNTDKIFYFQNGVLKSESQAWDWAMRHALPTVSQEAWRYGFYNGLDSYRAGFQSWGYGRPGYRLYNGNRDWHSFVPDAPGVVFKRVKEAMINGK